MRRRSRLPHEAEALAAVGAGLHALDPVAVRQEPRYGLAHSTLEAVPRRPLQCGAGSRGVDRVAEVVTWPVPDERDQTRVTAARIRCELVEQRAQRTHHLD